MDGVMVMIIRGVHRRFGRMRDRWICLARSSGLGMLDQLLLSGYFRRLFYLVTRLRDASYVVDILILSTSSVSVSTNTNSFVCEKDGTVMSLTDWPSGP
jgi:hypothetical protein